MFRHLVAAIIAFLCLSKLSFAGYAQLAPPPGLTTVGSVSTMPVGTAANGARYAGGHVMANATLNVGARSVTVPVGFRVAANAATFTATKLNPWIAGLSLVASAIPFVVDWFDDAHDGGEILEYQVDPVNKKIVKKAENAWEAPSGFGEIEYWGTQGVDPKRVVDANGKNVFELFAQNPNVENIGGTCHGYGGQGGKYWFVAQPSSGCPGQAVTFDWCRSGGTNQWGIEAGLRGSIWICTSAASMSALPQMPPPSLPTAPTAMQWDYIAGKLSNFPVNPKLLEQLGSPIPVDPVPVINPASEPSGDVLVGPNGNPAPQLQPSAEPLRYPDGDPIPNPNTNPQTYTQPWHEVWPSPTPSEPWRVDVRPVTTIVNSPNPAPDPTPNPGTGNPSTGSGQTDCDKYPGSLGCVPIGTPTTVEIPRSTRDITLQQGPEFSGGGCPADVMLSIHGASIKALDIQQACGWVVNWVKPLVLLLAAISAVFIVYPKGD